MKQFYSQPIVHFLGLGLLLFVLYAWISRDSIDIDSSRIVVDEETVLQYVQYRNKAFNRDAAEFYISQLAEEIYQDMLQRMVREEVLYREAMKLGLDDNDYVIKQRLIQKMEYLAGGFGGTANAINEDDVLAYYEAHQTRYNQPANYTFTHVFVDKSDPNPKQRANQLLAQLNAEAIAFSDALKFGDRFLYHSNYVERDPDYIDSHFGNSFSAHLAKASAGGNTWIGPFQSEYGLHLVLLTKKEPGGVPPLAEIYNQVYHDAYDTRLKEQTEQTVQKIIDAYDVEIKALDKNTLFARPDAS